MNHIPIEKLYNPQYKRLPVYDKKKLLNRIAEIYNLELICFGEFFAFEKSTYTALYCSKDDIKFVFVPGHTVKLGINFDNKKLHEIFNKENLEELAYAFVDCYEDEPDSENFIAEKIKKKLADEEFLLKTENYLNNNFSKEEDCVIHPLLVQKE